MPTMHGSTRIPLVLLFAAALPAQLFLAGTSQRTVANSYTRAMAGFGAGELLQKFDADQLRGFGIEAAFPNVQTVRGVVLQVRDFGSSVPDGSFTLSLYTEDPLRPDFPELSSPLVSLPGLIANGFPLGVTTVVFPNPVGVPIGRDLFVGVRVNAMTSQFGGTRLNVLFGNAGASNYELPGGGLPTSPPEQASHRLFRDVVTDAVTYQSSGQYMIDLLTSAPSGFPSALTNQANYALSTIVPGCTTMLSGLHPDAASPPRRPGRVDEVGFVYTDPLLAPGDPVLFVASFGTFGPIVPLHQLVPGSVGGLCLPTTDLFPLGIVALGAGNSAFLMQTLDPAVRPALHGQAWVQQAIGYDLVNGVLRGSQCGRQRF